MTTLGELRTLVRTQTETTDSELPNSTLDWYIRQAFARTIAAENTWPSYETSWSLTLPAGERSLDIPLDCNRASINSLISLTVDNFRNFRLNMTDHETAEGYYLGNAIASATTYPFEYSIWSEKFWLWPMADTTVDKAFTLRGHRYPTDWVALGEDSEVDADSRLHQPLAHYAIALAYAQQEDEVLESVYMGRWQRDVDAARGAIMEPSRQQPMSFGGGRRDFRRGTFININRP